MLTIVRLVTLLVVIASAVAHAQDGPPRGTDFWLTFLERFIDKDRPDDPQTMLRLDVVAFDRASDVRVEVPGAGWSAEVSLAARGAGSIIVPAVLVIAEGSEQVDMRGIHVTATAPITVVAVSHVPGSADATIVLPVDGLANDYVAATYDAFSLRSIYDGPAEIGIVAIDDSTVVEITPTSATLGGRPAGVPFTVALDRGATYQMQSRDNLTGTRVRTLGNACDRIAVFAGNRMALVDSCNAVDHLFEQMLPVRALGREYLVVPFAGRTGGDVLEVIAIEDSTIVSDWRGGPPVGLDAGWRLRTLVDRPARVQSSRPVAVVQYERGSACDGADEGDPAMVQLRPLAADTLISFVAPGQLGFARHYVSIISPTAAAASVRIDGAAVAGFTPFADDPAHSWAQTEIQPGPRTVSGAALAAVVVHGAGPAVSYAMDASGSMRAFPGPDDVPIVESCECEGVTLAAPPGYARYRWSTGDTTRTIVAPVAGDYAVTVSSGACTITSHLRTVAVGEPGAITLEPSIATAEPGDIIPYTLVVDRSAGICSPEVQRLGLRFRASMLVADALKGATIVADTIDGEDRILTLELHRDTVLLDMVVALGDTTAVVVTLDATGNDTCMRSRGDVLSILSVEGCVVGGRRLFLDGETTLIKPVRPEPVRGVASIEFRTLERGLTRLELVDALGRRAALLVESILGPGDHAAALDATILASGTYTLVLTTPSGQVVRRTYVAR